ncbi:unnamed protein product, partial [Menidia menidia]
PCSRARARPPPDCSNITWTFFRSGRVRHTEEVRGGRVRAGSDKAERMTVARNCSVVLRALRVDDAGSYVCVEGQRPRADVYVSVLAVGSRSPVSQLRAGGRLALSCVLHTYYDAGSCKPYSSSAFGLQWREDGHALPARGTRHQLVENGRCNITLVATLQPEDDNRRWTCLVNTSEHSQAAAVDIRSSFLIQRRPPAAPPTPPAGPCPARPPISRIVLVVALPLMVVFVWLFSWRADHKRDKTPAVSLRLQEVHRL